MNIKTVCAVSASENDDAPDTPREALSATGYATVRRYLLLGEQEMSWRQRAHPYSDRRRILSLASGSRTTDWPDQQRSEPKPTTIAETQSEGLDHILFLVEDVIAISVTPSISTANVVRGLKSACIPTFQQRRWKWRYIHERHQSEWRIVRYLAPASR